MPEQPETIGPVRPEIEAANYLDISPATLELDRRTGRLGIPFVRIGRRVGYLLSDLDKWLNNHRIIPK